jgi:hypothetical protein
LPGQSAKTTTKASILLRQVGCIVRHSEGP